MNCRFSTDAAVELEHAFDFYNQRSSELGQQFLDSIMDGIHRLTETPARWPQIQPNIRRYRINRFNYLLIYHVVDDCAVIIAVMHPSRRPGYWKNRI